MQVKVNLKIAGVKDKALHLSIKVGPFMLLTLLLWGFCVTFLCILYEM